MKGGYHVLVEEATMVEEGNIPICLRGGDGALFFILDDR